MNIKHIYLLASTALALSMSGAAIAKQPNNHGNPHRSDFGSEASQLNSNRQSDPGSLRGRDRAEEREDFNQSRDFDNARTPYRPQASPQQGHSRHGR